MSQPIVGVESDKPIKCEVVLFLAIVKCKMRQEYLNLMQHGVERLGPTKQYWPTMLQYHLILPKTEELFSYTI
jgi:hypothetical protein